MVWLTDVPVAGTYELEWRHAQMEDRDMALSVNDVQIAASVAFSNTGSWNSAWESSSVTEVTLEAGINKIRLATNGGSGPNLDYMRILPPEVGDAGSVGDAGTPIDGGAITVDASATSGR